MTESDFYVSPQGNDEWSGRLAKPNADKTDGAFRTLARARDAVREFKKDNPRDVTVLIRGGEYQLSETLVFGLEDSAAPGHEITYAAYGDETPVLTSAVQITDWRKPDHPHELLPPQAREKVFVADVPQGLNKFHTLYAAGRMIPRARSAPTMPTLEHGKEPPGDPRRTLMFPQGLIRNRPNIDDVEIIILPTHRWVMNILALESVDEENHIATTRLPATYPMARTTNFKETLWVENALEYLDRPARWALDSHARKVYLWPEGDDPPAAVSAPALRELVRVEGDVDVQGPADKPASGINFVGLTFTCGDRDVWRSDDRGIQHDWEMEDKPNALLRFRGAQNCSVKHCRFIDSGQNAVRADLHARDITVTGCEMARLGGAAVMCIGYGPGTKNVNGQNTITNNHVHHCGLLFWHSQMITLWQSGGNTVAHNYIHHVPRKAVCLSGVRPQFFRPDHPEIRECRRGIRWHETGDAHKWEQILPFLHTCDNTVEYNEIHHALQMLGDGSTVNVSGAGEGNVIRRNFIHDVNNTHASGLMRTDDFQKGTLFEENVLFRSLIGGITLKGENHIVNNYFVDVGSDSKDLIHTNGKWGTPSGWPFGAAKIVRNIFFSLEKDQHFYYQLTIEQLDEFDRAEIDYNVYYTPAGQATADIPLLKALRQRGHDEHTYYGDPKFADWKNADFTLVDDSPALKLGIKQIDISPAGLTDDFPFPVNR